MTTINKVVANNLPRADNFIGREYAIEEVIKALDHRAWVISIEGIGGIGKTSLTLEVAHRLLRNGSYDAIIWTSADKSWRMDYSLKYEPESDFGIDQLLQTIAKVLGVNVSPTDTTQTLRQRVDDVLHKFQCLVIVDNLETIQRDKYESIVEFLRNLPSPNKAIVTSRRRAETGEIPVKLNEMKPDEAVELLVDCLEEKGLNTPPREKLEEICSKAGYLPIAIKWVVGQMSVKGQTIDLVLKRLSEPRGDVLKFCFDSSLSLLDSRSQRVLFAMPAFAVSASQEAIESISEVRANRLEESLELLQTIYLMHKRADDRYFVLPATASCLQAQWNSDIDMESDYMRKAADYYTRVINRVATLKRHSELGEEHHNIRSIVDWCTHQAEWKYIINLASGLCAFLRLHGYSNELLQIAQLGQDAAVENGEMEMFAKFKQYEGSVYKYTQKYDLAASCFQAVLDYYQGVGHLENVAWATMQLGIIAEHQASYSLLEKEDEKIKLLELAETRYKIGLETFRKLNNKRGVARILHLIGRIHQSLKKFDTAKDMYVQSIQIKEELADPEVVITKYQLASLLHEIGQYDVADTIYKDALATVTEQGWIKHIANVKSLYAQLKFDAGDYDEAAKLSADADEGFEFLGRSEKQKAASELRFKSETKLRDVAEQKKNFNVLSPIEGNSAKFLFTLLKENEVQDVLAKHNKTYDDRIDYVGIAGTINALIDFYRNRNRLDELVEQLQRLVGKHSSHIPNTHVLAVFANPKNSNPLRLENESRVIRQCIERSIFRASISLDIRHAIRVDDFARALLEREYRIVHFAGHGTEQGLAFENEQGEVHVVPQDALAETLSVYAPPLECVILNACYSNVHESYFVLSGIPYVIIMQGAISDESATEFTRGFYDAIGAGKDVEFAYQEGCRRVKLKALPDWSIPILFPNPVNAI